MHYTTKTLGGWGGDVRGLTETDDLFLWLVSVVPKTWNQTEIVSERILPQSVKEIKNISTTPLYATDEAWWLVTLYCLA